MITSSTNPQVKEVIRLRTKARARREAGLFVAEGRKLFLETPDPLRERVYVAASYEEEARELPGMKAYETVDDRLFSRMCDTQTPQGILTVARMPRYAEEELLDAAGEMWLLLEDIQDPGNLGTIFRTAEAAGVAGIFMSRGCADLFSPKVVRSTMGSVFRVPFLITDKLVSLAESLTEHGISLIATTPTACLSHKDIDKSGARAFMIGNEGNGLSAAMLDAAPVHVSIPMKGQIESLNAAIATAILLFS